MKHWRNIPEAHNARHQISSLALPEEAIKDELEALPKPMAVAEAPHVLALKEKLKPFSAAPMAHLESIHALSARVRQDQKTLSDKQKTTFKDAVSLMVKKGAYKKLVLIHADMSHNMHGSMGAVGMQRFLSWHRRYLIEFENALIAVHKELGGTDSITLPYWHWPDPFPQWLVGFLPQTDPDSGNPPPKRKDAAPPQKPSEPDETYILKNFGNQLPGTQTTDYTRFTYGLEGWGKRANGTSLPAHNHVHDWVGGIMSDTSYSPTDPIFWLHHGEVDHLWSVWQKTHPNEHPSLDDKDRIMDPWKENYDQLASTEGLGYIYA